jgi:hypothetical protein
VNTVPCVIEPLVLPSAVLMSRMSMYSPAGGLSHDAETWDAAPVRHVEDSWKRSGRESMPAAAGPRPATQPGPGALTAAQDGPA